jgi:hypothetical protein
VEGTAVTNWLISVVATDRPGLQAKTSSPNGMHPSEASIRKRSSQHFHWSEAISWACQDLNLGPHPYQQPTGNRCAHRPFRRSRPTVGGEVTGSIGRQLRVLLQTAASTAGLSRCSGASWRSAGSRRSRYLIPKQTGLRLDPERYLRYYNTERAHTGRWTKGRTQQRSSRRPSCGTSNADASPQLGDRTQRLIVGLHRRRP